MPERLSVVILGGLFGVVSTLIPIVEKWLRERRVQDQQDQYVDRITKKVALWDAWFKVQQSVCSPEELEKVKGIVAVELEHLSPDWQRQSSAQEIQIIPRSLARRLVLAYKPVRAVAWIPRVFFYAFLAYLCAAVFFTFRSWAQHPISDPIVWLLLLIVIALVWLFRSLSVRLEAGTGKTVKQ